VTFAAGDNPTAAEFNDLVPRYAYKTSDETIISNSTLQNDDFLALTVAASTKYEFELYMAYNTGTTPDLKIGWTLPTGATNAYHVDYFDTAAASQKGQSSTVPTTGFAVGGFGSDLYAVFAGTISVSTTAGTMQIQWAQNTLTASNSTVRAGSFLRLQKIP
jgi:hypothetical protein